MEKEDNLKSDFLPDYVGDSIMFYEMPYGCEIVSLSTGQSVVVRSTKDAKRLIESLLQMIMTMLDKSLRKKK